jgi:hypothetical protein
LIEGWQLHAFSLNSIVHFKNLEPCFRSLLALCVNDIKLLQGRHINGRLAAKGIHMLDQPILIGSVALASMKELRESSTA